MLGQDLWVRNIFEGGDKVVDLRVRWSNDKDVIHIDANVEGSGVL